MGGGRKESSVTQKRIKGMKQAGNSEHHLLFSCVKGEAMDENRSLYFLFSLLTQSLR